MNIYISITVLQLLNRYESVIQYALQRLQAANNHDGNEWALGAYNLDGSYHQCRQKQEQRQEPQPTLTLEMVDIRLKRVEKMLFNATEGK
jgi:hypothetical protein